MMVMACLSGTGKSDLAAMVRHLLAYVRKSSSGLIFSEKRSKSVGDWYVRWLNCETNFTATVSNEARSAADRDVNQLRASTSNDLWNRWTNMAWSWRYKWASNMNPLMWWFGSSVPLYFLNLGALKPGGKYTGGNLQ